MQLKPYLLNPENQDTVLYLSVPQRSEVFLFDLGYCYRLKGRDILKISRIFISHTHVDHFAGFDHILRICLDMDKTISIYGPPGFIDNVRGKLSSYSWNLKEGIKLSYHVYEIHEDKLLSILLRGNQGFRNENPPEISPRKPEDPIFTDGEITLRTVTLDHLMPVLAYRISACADHNVNKEKMAEMDLKPGRWVGEMKRRAGTEVAPWETIDTGAGEYPLQELTDRLIITTPGTEIVYLVDTIFNHETAEKIKRFVKNADILFCETSFLDSEKTLAEKYYHMTALQAGEIARDGNVGKLHPIHFSKRYERNYGVIYNEARTLFPRVEKARRYS